MDPGGLKQIDWLIDSLMIEIMLWGMFSWEFTKEKCEEWKRADWFSDIYVLQGSVATS